MKLQEFKQLAKTMTRYEFLNTFKNTIYFTTECSASCPSDINLKDQESEKCYFNNEEDNSCYSCWNNAIKDIEFRNE